MHAPLERLVGQGERGVRADQATDQRRVRGTHPGEEATVLGEARPGALGPVSIGRLVAQDGADPQFGEGRGDDVE